MATSAVATAVGSSIPQITLPPHPDAERDRARGSEDEDEEEEEGGGDLEVGREKEDGCCLPLLSKWVKAPAPVAVAVACGGREGGREGEEQH